MSTSFLSQNKALLGSYGLVTQAMMSISFLSQNQAMLGTLRSCDSGNDEYRLLESE